MKRAAGIIPARWASTRFPGKALAPICGRPLIAWVLDRARQARALDTVLVATDDERIAACVESAGGAAVMTRPDHPCGTDRIAEAAAQSGADLVVNIQGDEPLIDPALIDRAVRVLREDDEWDMVTAAGPLRDPDELRNPSAVKAVFAKDGRALYFSRSVIPHQRDAGTAPDDLYWRHIGLYAYTHVFLQRFVAAPPCPAEEAEKLEQLRALHIGGRMHVLRTDHRSIGVDTPEDIPRAEAALRAAGLAE